MKRMPKMIHIYSIIGIIIFVFNCSVPWIDRYLDKNASFGVEIVFGLFLYIVCFVYAVIVLISMVYPIVMFKREKFLSIVPMAIILAAILISVCIGAFTRSILGDV